MQEEITIEKAEKFFLNGETWVAGNMAGILFERSVQKLCAFHQIPLSNSHSTREFLDLLRDAYVLSKEKHRELQNLVSIRNKCAHATPVTREEVQTLIQGTKTFTRRVESQSSIGPETEIRGKSDISSISHTSSQPSPPPIKRGDLVDGVIVRIDRDEILIDIGLKSEAVLPTTELPATGKWAFDQLYLNNKVLAYVIQPETPNGHAWLSLQLASTNIDHKNKTSKSSSRPHLDGEYTGHVVLCAGCRDEMVIPFLPVNNRPVYCRFCKSWTGSSRGSVPTSVTSRIASAKRFVTQHPSMRKQPVCPVCGKDNCVRKASGITRNSLLEFPASLSPWGSSIFRESKRMSGREQSFYALGCLIFILGFVLSCAWFGYTSSQGSAWPYVFTFGISILGAFIGFRFRRKGAKRLEEDRLKAFEIWDTLYYCDRDDALFSSERPEYYVSAAHMREMLGY